MQTLVVAVVFPAKQFDSQSNIREYLHRKLELYCGYIVVIAGKQLAKAFSFWNA